MANRSNLGLNLTEPVDDPPEGFRRIQIGQGRGGELTTNWSRGNENGRESRVYFVIPFSY